MSEHLKHTIDHPPTGRVVPVRAVTRHGFERTFPENPNVRWCDIGGLEDVKEALREAIEYPVLHRDLYEKYRKRPTRGILLYGPSGCGKTLLAKACATALHVLLGEEAEGGFIALKGPYTADHLRAIFAQAREYKLRTGHRAVVFLDDAESLLGDRSSGRPDAVGLRSTVVTTFLAEMDGMEDSGVVILSTNLPDALDPSITRARRIDRKIEVPRPGREQAREIFSLHLRGKPVQAGQTTEQLVDVAVGALFDSTLVLKSVKLLPDGRELELTLGDLSSGALIEGIVERAVEFAIQRERSGGVEGLGPEDIRRAAAGAARESSENNLKAAFLEKLSSGFSPTTGDAN